MARTHKPREDVFAVVRVDLPVDQDDPSNSITVKQVVYSEGVAQQEVQRLSRLNNDKSCLYLATPTRLFVPGTSAGPDTE